MAYKEYSVSPVNPNSYRFLESSYNAQNFLVVQYDFPQKFYKDENDWTKGDFIGDVYSDRIPNEIWIKACKSIKSKVGAILDDWVKVPKEQLLNFANVLNEESLKGTNMKITGIRIVRYTNVSTGYPLWRIDTFAKAEDTPQVEGYKELYDKEYIRELSHNMKDDMWFEWS